MPANITQQSRFLWGTIATIFLTFSVLHLAVMFMSFLPQSTPTSDTLQPYQPDNQGRPAVMVAPGSR